MIRMAVTSVSLRSAAVLRKSSRFLGKSQGSGLLLTRATCGALTSRSPRRVTS